MLESLLDITYQRKFSGTTCDAANFWNFMTSEESLQKQTAEAYSELCQTS